MKNINTNNLIQLLISLISVNNPLHMVLHLDFPLYILGAYFPNFKFSKMY